MIGTELQEFQKWLEYCDFRQVGARRVGDDRTYLYEETENGHVYTFEASGGHASDVVMYFGEDGTFHGFQGYE